FVVSVESRLQGIDGGTVTSLIEEDHASAMIFKRGAERVARFAAQFERAHVGIHGVVELVGSGVAFAEIVEGLGDVDRYGEFFAKLQRLLVVDERVVTLALGKINVADVVQADGLIGFVAEIALNLE